MSTRNIVIVAIVGIALLAAVVIAARAARPEPKKGVVENWLGLPAGLL